MKIKMHQKTRAYFFLCLFFFLFTTENILHWLGGRPAHLSRQRRVLGWKRIEANIEKVQKEQANKRFSSCVLFSCMKKKNKCGKKKKTKEKEKNRRKKNNKGQLATGYVYQRSTWCLRVGRRNGGVGRRNGGGSRRKRMQGRAHEVVRTFERKF